MQRNDHGLVFGAHRLEERRVRLVARGWFSDTTAYCVARVYAVLTRLLNWGW